MATCCSKTAVTQLMRIGWRTVGAVVARVWADTEAQTDRLAGLRRIGIDEISYKKRHKYLTVVVDHDSGRLLWAEPGRDKATLNMFFTLLGPERCAKITHVSADAADWVAGPVAVHCPQAVRVMDPFHTVKWATDALDVVRREVWNTERKGKGRTTPGSKSLKKARFALWKNPEDLTAYQRSQLQFVAKAHPVLHRAYLLKAPRPEVRHRHSRGPAGLGDLGPPLPHRRLRRAPALHRQALGRDHRGGRARPVQRTRRIDEHQDPADHPDRLRLQEPSGPYRPGHAQPRRPPPPPTRPSTPALTTHGSDRRARKRRRLPRRGRGPRRDGPGRP
ncbi:hypothetical protein F0344_34580 (plasmid) [Streptomyces finlayi]|uniref:Transposase IS204/IS1001/IS1096/IS1165 DDE domain-containing protein n=1 Tax=Streptomyces finlayi TaxID=67296 RepID=A0A7G7BW77_9ACTN|nr:hypothetical protein F0344_34580 [Streptomyces finlayi]